MRRLAPLAAGAAGLAALGMLAACGDSARDAPSAPAGTDVQPAGDLLMTRYAATVLDDGGGPELCLGVVAMSHPPQCGGPPVIGWDWAAHSDATEEAAGVRWGSFVLTGHYDGEVFVVADVLPEDARPDPGVELPHLVTPCEEPDGGWRVVEPELATEAAVEDAFRAAAGLEGYAGSWTALPSPDAADAPGADGTEEEHVELERTLNDPEQLVLNVRVTGDAGAAEERLREVWGGALCVSSAEHSEAELRAVQDAVFGDAPGALSAGVDTIGNVVFLDVIHDDGSIQEQLDAEHGEGVVRVMSMLIPAR